MTHSEIDKFLDEINDLKLAKELLSEVFWGGIGPYCDLTPSTDLKIRLQRYFNFDDSE